MQSTPFLRRLLAAAFAVLPFACTPMTDPQAPASASSDDPYLWLEDVGGDKALAWVRAQNEVSKKQLTESASFAATQARILAILDSKERIPYVGKQGPHLYNLWQDAQNPRGLWRRTTADEYRKDQPGWEVVLDLDALGKQEGGCRCRAAAPTPAWCASSTSPRSSSSPTASPCRRRRARSAGTAATRSSSPRTSGPAR